jgi:hypothetical protein
LLSRLARDCAFPFSFEDTQSRPGPYTDVIAKVIQQRNCYARHSPRLRIKGLRDQSRDCRVLGSIRFWILALPGEYGFWKRSRFQ